MTKDELVLAVENFIVDEGMSKSDIKVSLELLGLGEKKIANIFTEESIFMALFNKLTKSQMESLHIIVTDYKWKEDSLSSEEIDSNHTCNECNTSIETLHNEHCPVCGSYDVSKKVSIAQRLIEESSPIEYYDLDKDDIALEEMSDDELSNYSLDNLHNMYIQAKIIVINISKNNLNLEFIINSDMTEWFAKERNFNLADFVYQIVLAYNELSETNVPIAKSVEPIITDDWQTTKGINEIFNKVEQMVELIEVMDSNELQIMDNGHIIVIVDKNNYYHVFHEDEHKGTSIDYKAITIADVTDFISQKLG